mgnify:CR=1 FL=1
MEKLFENENGYVSYQKPICGDSGTLMFIIETPGSLKDNLIRDIINFGNIQVSIRYSKETQNFTIEFGDLSQKILSFHSYMIMIKWDRKTFNTELNVYEYKHPEEIPIYKVRPEMYYFDFENPVGEILGVYNNDYNMSNGMECRIHTYPLFITNIKYYNKSLNKIEAIKESLKYATQHDNCVINDLARHINSGHGYIVK